MHEIYSKIRPKNYIFGAVSGCHEAEKSHIWPLSSLHIKFPTPYTCLEDGLRRNRLFLSLKSRKTLILPPNLPRRLIFGYDVQLWIRYELAHERMIFGFFDFSAPLPSNLGIILGARGRLGRNIY